MKQEMPLSKLDASGLLLLLLLASGIGLALGMLRPFLDAILLALIFATIMNPVHQKLLALLGGRRSLAASLTSMLLTLLVLIPGFLIVWHFLLEAAVMFQTLTQWVGSDAFQEFIKHPKIVRLMTTANKFLAEFQGLTTDPNSQRVQDSQMASQIITSVAGRILDHGTYIVQHGVSLLINFLLMILAFFFILRDQEALRDSVFQLMPFASSHEVEICSRIVSITRSTLLGIFLTAIAQGIGAAIAFWIIGLPVLFGSVVTAFTSFVPMMSSTLVWLPATIYLLFANKVGSAIFLSIWWLVVITFLLDNVLRSILVGRKTAVSTPLIFFFILGGIHFFGVIGVIYGPLVLLGLYMLLYLYGLAVSTPEIIMPEERGRE